MIMHDRISKGIKGTKKKDKKKNKKGANKGGGRGRGRKQKWKDAKEGYEFSN